jgi:hypothetical protein
MYAISMLMLQSIKAQLVKKRNIDVRLSCGSNWFQKRCDAIQMEKAAKNILIEQIVAASFGAAPEAKELGAMQR